MAQNWQFVSAGTPINSQSPMSVGVPSGYTLGDLLIIVFVGHASSTYASCPGWTVVPSATYGGKLGTTVLYKTASSSETNASLTIAGSNNTDFAAVMICYRYIGTLDVVQAVYNSVSSSSPTTSSITTTSIDDLVLSIFTCNSSTNSWTAPAGVTTRVLFNANGTYGGILICDENKATAGATTARVATLTSGKNTDAIAISFKNGTLPTSSGGNFLTMFFP